MESSSGSDVVAEGSRVAVPIEVRGLPPAKTLEPRLPSEPRYNSPPPAYPCIQGAAAAAHGVSNNLGTSFVSMKLVQSLDNTLTGSEEEYGKLQANHIGTNDEPEGVIEMGKVYDVQDAFAWGFEGE